MIGILDIETSGLNTYKCGIWEATILNYKEPEDSFSENCRIDDEDIMQDGADQLTGTSEEQMRDRSKQSQKQLLANMFSWAEDRNILTMVVHNPTMETLIWSRAFKYNLPIPFGHRIVDTHSIAFGLYTRIHGKEPMIDGKSTMGLPKVLEFCGLPDPRREMSDMVIIRDGVPHTSMHDCRLTCEVYSRMVNGKSLLPEFKQFSVPEYLLR